MNTQLLLGLGLTVGLAVLVLALLLRARRQPPPARPAAPPAAEPPAADETPVRPAGGVPDDAAAHPGASHEAQRQAATEALRLARQRRADETARQQAELAAQAGAAVASRAGAAARARPGPEAMVVAAPPPTPVVAEAAAPRPPVVLVADDSKVVRVKTGRLLEKQGWRVLLAEDGAAAMQVLVTESPDVLITDVEMPEVDGFELTRRVRAHSRYGRLPVIMITSSDERHRAEAQAAGVNLLLGKPYAEETLLSQVQALLPATARDYNGRSLACAR